MARKGFIHRQHYKTFDIWPQRWSQIPDYNVTNLPHHIRKLLIYYPKDPQLLKMLTLEINSNNNYNQSVQGIEARNVLEIRRLYRKIESRYKKDLLLYQNIDINWDKAPIWQTCRTAHFLKLGQTGDRRTNPSSILKKSVKTNKRLKAIYLGTYLNRSGGIISHLGYIRSLESIYIENIPSIPRRMFEKGLFASKLKLKTVTLQGKFKTANPNSVFEEQDAPYKISQLIKLIIQLPNLKQFNFDVNTTDPLDQLDINQIPFNLMKKKNMSYDIRFVNTSNKELTLSAATEVGLETLEFLGINALRAWPEKKPVWNAFQEGQLKAQEACQKVLFISLFDKKQPDVSNLLMACRKIKTLYLSLSTKFLVEGVILSGLKYLENLQNLYLVIDNTRSPSFSTWSVAPEKYEMDLFQNLSSCTGRLKSLSIQLTERELFKHNETTILDFFESCSKTLTHLTLQVSCPDQVLLDLPKAFYDGINLLERLESLKLPYNYTVPRFKLSPYIYQFEKFTQYQNLRELCLSIPPWQGIESKLSELENLEKLQLEVREFEKREKILEQMSDLVKLKHLEMSIADTDKTFWSKVLKAVSKLKSLEKMIIKCDLHGMNEYDLEKLLAELKKLKENHSSLVSIAYQGCKICPGIVWLFGKNSLSWKEDIDSFLWRNEEGIPKKRRRKVYCL